MQILKVQMNIEELRIKLFLKTYKYVKDDEITVTTLDMRQSKTLLTINEHGSKIARNSVFDWRQMAIQNCFLRFLIYVVDSFLSFRLPPIWCGDTNTKNWVASYFCVKVGSKYLRPVIRYCSTLCYFQILVPFGTYGLGVLLGRCMLHKLLVPATIRVIKLHVSII